MSGYVLPRRLFEVANRAGVANGHLLRLGHGSFALLVDQLFILEQSIEHGVPEGDVLYHFLVGVAGVGALRALGRVLELLDDES